MNTYRLQSKEVRAVLAPAEYEALLRLSEARSRNFAETIRDLIRAASARAWEEAAAPRLKTLDERTLSFEEEIAHLGKRLEDTIAILRSVEQVILARLDGQAQLLEPLVRMSIVFAIQNTAGLKDIYGPQGGPAVEEAFTNRITLLNGLNAEDAEKLSKRLGCYTRVRKQQQGTPTHDRAELIPLEEVLRRGAGEQDRWAVFEIVGATASKRPVIARLVPSALVIRKPEPAEVSPHAGRSSESLHSLRKEAAELTPCPSPCIPADSGTEEFGGF